MRRLVSLREAAQQLGVSIAAVRGWRIRRKYLDFVKIGGSVRIPQTSIDKLIEEQTERPDLNVAERNVEN